VGTVPVRQGGEPESGDMASVAASVAASAVASAAPSESFILLPHVQPRHPPIIVAAAIERPTTPNVHARIVYTLLCWCNPTPFLPHSHDRALGRPVAAPAPHALPGPPVRRRSPALAEPLYCQTASSSKKMGSRWRRKTSTAFWSAGAMRRKANPIPGARSGDVL
jgi:hypothetical protein